ncbi:MAG: Reticulocyte binding protein [uncultured bacterium]|nr:MAG: Reticulocyte binding protein [uncultured bacterium]
MCAKKRKKSISPTKALAINFISAILSDTNVNSNCNKLKYLFSETQQDEILHRANPHVKKIIFQNPMPASYGELKAHHHGVYLDVNKELSWITRELIYFSKVISKFVELQSQYEIAFLEEDKSRAFEYLDAIKKEVGVSLWSLENEFLLREHFDGLSNNLQYLNSINKEACNNPWLLCFADFFSKKVENNISLARFDSIVGDFLGTYDQKTDSQTISYFNYRLRNYTITLDDVNTIIGYEANSSIIDRYITFKNVLLTASFYSQSELSNTILEALFKIKKYITDGELDNVVISLNPQENIYTKTSQASDFISICDLYTVGRYEDCLESSSTSLKYIGNSFELYELAAKSIVCSNKNLTFPDNVSSLQKVIIGGLVSLYSKNSNYLNSLSRLLKIANAFSSQNWAKQMGACLLMEIDPKFDNFLYVGYLLKSKFFNPLFCQLYVSTYNSREFLKRIRACYSDSKTIQLWDEYYDKSKKMITIEDLPDLPEKRVAIYSSRKLFKASDYDSAIKILEKYYITSLSGEVDNYSVERIITELFYCYLFAEKYDKLFGLVSDFYFYNKYIIAKLDLKNAMERFDDAERKDCYGLYTYPIASHIAGLEVYQIYVACDNYLSSIGLECPSQLSDRSDIIEKKAFIFLLSEVFVEAVLSKFLVLGSTEEVESERIKILQILIEIDPDNSVQYSDEINNITRRATIKKYIQFVDESKIYIGIDGVKQYAEDIIRESYQRYIEIKAMPVDIDNLQLVDFSKNKIILRDRSSGCLNMYPDLKLAIFSNIIREIRDSFISNREFGLNNYLSMRIRHGTLKSQLRKPFDANNLISKKDQEGLYQPIAFWNDVLRLNSVNDFNSFMGLIKFFSEEIDKMIAMVKDEWIQIKTESQNQKGLFDFTLTEEDLVRLFARMAHIDSWDIFFKTTIDFLFERLQLSLNFIRQTIKNDLTELMISKLNIFNEFIDTCPHLTGREKVLHFVTKCRTDIQFSLKKISNWFNLSQNKELDSFDIQIAIEAALQLAENLHRQNLIPSIENNVGKHLRFKGLYFNSIIDMTYILLENIIKHSNLTGANNKVIIEINLLSEQFALSVKNSLSSNYDFKKSSSRLENIKAKLNKDDALESTSKEGGTGILKIRKILQYDLRCSSYKILPLLSNDAYQISIVFPFTGLIK